MALAHADSVAEAKDKVVVKEAQMMKGGTKSHFTTTIAENQATKNHTCWQKQKAEANKEHRRRQKP